MEPISKKVLKTPQDTTGQEPKPAAVGEVYDHLSDGLTTLLGGCTHLGYWDYSVKDQTAEAAADRLTSAVAARLNIKPGQSVLDVGCGSGKPTVHIATMYHVNVTGITVSKRQIEMARARTLEPMQGGGSVSFQLADAMDMPFADASFDGAIAIEAFCHIGDKGTALAEIARVLRPGSRLVIADLFCDEGCDPKQFAGISQLMQAPTIVTDKEYRHLLTQAGLEVVDFTDIRHNVRPSYEILSKAFQHGEVSVDEVAGQALAGQSSDFEQMAAKLGYGLYSAVRA